MGAECVETILGVSAVHVAVGSAVDSIFLVAAGAWVDVMLVAQGACGSPCAALVISDESANAVGPDSDFISGAAAVLFCFELPFLADCE